MTKLKLLNVVLSLFDAGVAAPAAAQVGDVAAQSAADGKQAAAPEKAGALRRGNKSGGLNDVVYGRQAPPPEKTVAAETKASSDAGSRGEAPQTPDIVERRARFRELVDTDYKEVYQQEIQRIIDRRFKETKTLQESLNMQKPIIDSLFSRYKIQSGDLSALSKAIAEDGSYLEKAAKEAGVSADQYKLLSTLEKKNGELTAVQRHAKNSQSMHNQLLQWQAQQTLAHRAYPELNMSAEMKNPRFASMLRSGVPVKHAYEVVHLNDIKSGVARQTAKTTERNVVEGIRSKGNRPAENGVTSQSGVIVKSDVSKLTRADRAEIIKRVARGEKISF